MSPINAVTGQVNFSDGLVSDNATYRELTFLTSEPTKCYRQSVSDGVPFRRLLSMPSARNPVRWKFGLAAITFTALALFVAPDGAQQASTPPTQDANSPAFRLRVSSNLVLVPVIVRDAKGQPVTGL